MSELLAADYEAILDVVVDVAECRAVDSLSPDVVAAIHRLFPDADTVAFWGRPPSETRHATIVSGDYRPWTAAEDRLADRLSFADPLLPGRLTIGRPIRLSDRLPLELWRGSHFYRRLGRRHGLEYSLAFWFRTNEGGPPGLWLDTARRDFTDRDVQVLGLLGSRLERLIGRVGAVGPRRGSLRLTDREAEVLAHAAMGQTNSEIAQRLSISPNTVRKHLENTFSRLEVHTRPAAVARAWEVGILPRTIRT